MLFPLPDPITHSKLPHLSAIVFFLIGLCSPSLRGAAVVLPLPLIYDNGVSASEVLNGLVNDPDFSIYLEHADSFSNDSTVQLETIVWAGQYEGNNATTDNFVLRLFETHGGVIDPVAILETQLTLLTRVDSGNTAFGLTVYSYTGQLTPFSLTSGTYAISIYNDVSDGVEWFWGMNPAPVDGSYQAFLDPSSWTPLNPGAAEFSFSLYAVPEPSSSMLLLIFTTMALGRRLRSSSRRTIRW